LDTKDKLGEYFKYLIMRFTAVKWHSLGAAWNLAHMHTLNMISGLDAVR
jgi:hypothetical protein